MSQILIKPVLTEKTSKITEDLNRYVFEVSRAANKIQIKSAVEKAYGVTVTGVNTLRYSGKKKVRATRSSYNVGKTNACKKAIVSVAEGEAIDLYENI